jgi:hypothetical protein
MREARSRFKPRNLIAASFLIVFTLLASFLHASVQRAAASELTFKDIWGDEGYACGLTIDVNLVCWGVHAPTPPPVPQKYKTANKIIAVQWGWACLSDETFMIQCWGSGQEPDRMKFLSQIVRATTVVSVPYSACVQNLDRTVQCWQLSAHSDIDEFNVDTPPTGAFLEGTLVGNGETYCALTLQQEVTCWGGNSYTPEDRWVVKLEGQYSNLGMNGVETCGLKISGELSCLGNSSQAPYVPVEVNGVAKFFVGQYMGCVIDDSSQLHCWGGDRAYNNLNVPADLGAVSKVAFSSNGMCSLSDTGSVRCWGKPSQLAAGPRRVADPPKNLRVTTLGSSGLDVVWEKPETSGQTVERYEIFFRKSGSTWNKMLANVSAGTDFMISKLKPSTSYEIVVKAKYLAGYSAPSNTLKIGTLKQCSQSLLGHRKYLASTLSIQKQSQQQSRIYVKWARSALQSAISSHSSDPKYKENSPKIRLLYSLLNLYEDRLAQGINRGDISYAAKYMRLRDETQLTINTLLGRTSVYTYSDVQDASNSLDSAVARLDEVAQKIMETSDAIESVDLKCTKT